MPLPEEWTMVGCMALFTLLRGWKFHGVFGTNNKGMYIYRILNIVNYKTKLLVMLSLLATLWIFIYSVYLASKIRTCTSLAPMIRTCTRLLPPTIRKCIRTLTSPFWLLCMILYIPRPSYWRFHPYLPLCWSFYALLRGHLYSINMYALISYSWSL